LAEKAFGPARVADTVARVAGVLVGRGYLKALIGPAPRVIADDVWAKLVWAGLHLEPADLVPSARGGYGHPIELVRALAVTWLFSGLRADEITRLRTGCVRWRPSSEAPQDPVCLLDVPGA